VSERHTETLGQLVDDAGGVIRTGPFGSQLHRHEYVDDGEVAVVMPKDMIDGRIASNAIARIDRDTAARLREHLLRPADIVLARRGDIGRAAWVHPRDGAVLCGTGSMRIHIPDGKVAPRYLHYFLQAGAAAEWLQGQAVGATMPNLNANIVRGLPVRYPNPQTQQTIVEILDSIDHLIENTRERIALLEQMAQAIYREWFVHFRYPGHEENELVDSPLGPIPAGWNAMTLGEVAETQYGYTDSATESSEGPKFLRVMDINKRSYISWPDVPHCSPDAPERYRLAKGDVVIARMADPGKVGIVERDLDAVFASYLVRVRPVASWLQTYYLYFVLSATAYQEFVLGASTGTTRKSISAKVMEAGPIVRPAEVIVDDFVKTVTPLRVGISGLTQQNESLARIRDLLLPKLVTGAIDVSNLDLDEPLEESAA
jgi:type I restriction enzyme S subunit